MHLLDALVPTGPFRFARSPCPPRVTPDTPRLGGDPGTVAAVDHGPAATAPAPTREISTVTSTNDARSDSAAVPDRNLAMELVRVTEAAAIAGSRWVGCGDKNRADGAAVDAMRTFIETVQMNGTVVIGEGEKDEAPMLYNGEEVGDGTGAAVDVAVDPIDGTRLTAMGYDNALSVFAVAERGSMFDP